jgi:polysaccharide export outer membrane protein
MKKLVSSVLVALTMLLVLGSCGSTKNVAYFQNADSISLAASRMLYEAKIMPKDELTITVITTDPKAAMPFNLSVSQTLGTGGQLSYGSGSLQGYLVDNDGNIEFPVVGTLHVGGLTKKQAEDLIKNKVKPYLAEKENPIVTVRMGSYHVSVLGEVEKPGIIYAPQEKMSILEALAQCGDLTIYGKRDNVLLIRQDAAGEKHTYRMNLNDANIINSPFYYLQQNDQIYVEPNQTKKRNSVIGSSTSIWIASISSLTSITSLIVTLVRL